MERSIFDILDGFMKSGMTPKTVYLYSPAWGGLSLDRLKDDAGRCIVCIDGLMKRRRFYQDGSISIGGECVLFPGRQMREWSKFWPADIGEAHEGDLIRLESHGGYKVVEVTAVDDGRVDWEDEGERGTVHCDEVCKAGADDRRAWDEAHPEPVPAEFQETEKPGHGWDWEPKPFERVLVRDLDCEPWCGDLFMHMRAGTLFQCISGAYRQCLPWRRETEHLMGRTGTFDLDD